MSETWSGSFPAAGPDRGVDVFASPDGLGLQEPRVFVEVKHRPRETIGAPAIRSFLGGRHTGDRCLYVATGKFARYEAERSQIPLTLVDLPELASLFLRHYETLDAETRDLVPLVHVYWPLDT
jgi:restriction system protein